MATTALTETRFMFCRNIKHKQSPSPSVDVIPQIGGVLA